MAIISGITKLIMPAASKGMPEIVDYINQRSWNASTADIVEITVNEYWFGDLIEIPPFGTLGGLNDYEIIYYPGGDGIELPELQIAIASSGVVRIPCTNDNGDYDSLKFWNGTGGTIPYPSSKYIQIDTEVIEYYSIESSQTSASGYDEFRINDEVRGKFGSTAASHSDETEVKPVTSGIVSDIEYDTDTGMFTVRTKNTLMQDSSGTYGVLQGFDEAVVTYAFYTIPKEQVGVYEVDSGYTNFP
tara:strand:+ start:282 stop:1016 length:735 start_codon:yes stop_codon:yes gene_type:complete